MNHIFKSIYSQALGTWVAVPEMAKTHGKSAGGKSATFTLPAPRFACTALASALLLAGGQVMAAHGNKYPTGQGSDNYCYYDTASQSVVCGDAAANTLDQVGGGKTAKSVVIGKEATNTGESNVAIGIKSASAETASVAIGSEAKAWHNQSVAIGQNAEAHADWDISIGRFAGQGIQNPEAEGRNIAIGDGALRNATNPNNTTAIGTSAGAGSTGDFNVVIGTYANSTTVQASGVTANNVVAIGDRALAASNSAVAIGNRVKASGAIATAVGASANASGAYSISNGYGATSSGSHSIAIGSAQNQTNKTQATQSFAIAIGSNQTAATGSSAIAIGTQSAAATQNSIAIGNTAKANTQTGAIAIGATTTASGQSSVALGTGSTSTAQSTVAVGSTAKATGNNAVAIGDQAEATSSGTVSLGQAAGRLKDTTQNPAVPKTRTGNNSVFIGVKAGDQSDGNENQVAIGTSAAVGSKGANNIATGVEAGQYINGTGNVAMGHKAGQGAATPGTGQPAPSLKVLNNTVAVGTSATVGADSTVAIGHQANAQIEDSIAIGRGVTTELLAGDTQGNREGMIAIGSNTTKASGKAAVAIGRNAQSIGRGAVTLGDASKAQSGQGIAIGAQADVAANSAGGIAIGSLAKSSSTTAVAIGTLSNASTAHAVALGHESAANRAALTPGANTSASATAAGNTVYALGQATAGDKQAISNTVKGNFGAVSVGNATSTRQIINVAAGSEDTDAVNVAQLKAVANQLQAGQTHYYSVNSGDRNAGSNYNNDGATGVDALAAGVRASAAGRNGVAVGSDAEASGNESLAVGNKIVASGLGATAVGNNSRATAAGAQAFGQSSVASGANSAAIGRLATASGDRASAFGVGNTASGASSFAGGDKSVASGVNSTAIGLNAKAQDGNTIAVGNNASASATEAIAIGRDTQATKTGAIAMGQNSRSTGISSTAVGLESQASGNQSAAFGATAAATADQAMAIGFHTAASAQYSTALGNTAAASGTHASALGSGAKAIGGSSIAVGSGTATGGSSIAVGRQSKSYTGNDIAIGADSEAGVNGGTSSSNAIAIGRGAKATQLQAVAIGNGATVTQAHGVALGSNSIANIAAGQQGADPLGAGAGSGSVWRATHAAVSVGNGTTATRQIISVAAGTNDTDAVNVAQLKAAGFKLQATNAGGGESSSIVDDKIQNGETVTVDAGKNIKVTHTANTVSIATKDEVEFTKVTVGNNVLDATPITVNGNTVTNINDAINQTAAQAFNPLTFAGDSGTNVTRKLGETVNVKGGAAGNLTDGNIGVVANGTDTLTVKLAENVDLGSNGSVKMGNTTVNNNGLTIAGGPSITNAGIDAGNKTITNLAPGVNGTDAVNKAQLDAVVQQAGAAKTEVTGSGLATVTKIQGGNGQDIYNVDVATAAAPTVTRGNVTVAPADAGKVMTAGDVAAAINGSERTSSVVAGSAALTVAAGAEDAAGNTEYTVDLSQDTKDDITKGVSAHDTVTNKGLTFTGDSGTTGAKKLGDSVAITGDSNITTVADGNGVQIKLNPDLNVTRVTAGNTTINNNGLTITGGPSVTNAGIDAAGNKITNVAAGTAPTDAVNVSQLNQATAAAKTQVKSDNKTVTVSKSQDVNTGADVYDLSVKTGDSLTVAGDGTINVKTDGTTITTDGNGAIKANTTALTNGADGKVATPAAPNALATAGDIANAINNSGFTLKSSATTEGEKDPASTGDEVINPGEYVEMVAGKNMKVTQAANGKITYATKDVVDFTKVNVGGVVIDSATNKISGLAPATLDANSTEAVNGSQLYTTNQNVQTNADNIAKGINFGGNSGPAANNYQLGQTITVFGDNNITSTTVAGGTQLALAPVVSIGPATGGNPVTINGNAGTIGGLTNTTWDPNNITSGQAATEDQLKAATATTPLTNAADGTVNPIAPADQGKLATAGDIANAINNSGFTLTTSASDGTVSGTTSELVQTGETVTVDAGKNISVKQDGNKVSIATKDEVEFKNVTADKVTTGDTVMTTDGITINNGNAGPPVTLTKDGLNNGGNKITNVANGTDDGDAVNFSQLKAIKPVVNNIDARTYNIINNTTVSAGDNMQVTKQGDNYQVGLAPDIKLNSVTTGGVVMNANGLSVNGNTYVDAAGLNANGQTIRNVAAGRVAADSRDAVNGAQLHQAYQRMGDIDQRARAGIASAMASAGLPQAYRPGANMVAVSAGHYDGQSAVAVGASTISDNGRWILKGTLNVNSKDAGATVGVGYQW